MNTLISTAEREPRSKHYTSSTKQLFISAEELTEDVGKTALQLWSGNSRAQPLTLIRHCIMYTLRWEFDWNYTEIGTVFKRDHSSVVYACRRIKEFIEINDPQTMRYIQRLTKYNGTDTKDTEAQCIPCTCGPTQGTKV
jgi:chromosomal replication initiation ATPase DnaA